MGMPCSRGSTFLYHSTAQQSTEEQKSQQVNAATTAGDVAAANVMSLQTDDEHGVPSQICSCLE
jgi:hypothetical protein